MVSWFGFFFLRSFRTNWKKSVSYKKKIFFFVVFFCFFLIAESMKNVDSQCNYTKGSRNYFETVTGFELSIDAT